MLHSSINHVTAPHSRAYPATVPFSRPSPSFPAIPRRHISLPRVRLTHSRVRSCNAAALDFKGGKGYFYIFSSDLVGCLWFCWNVELRIWNVIPSKKKKKKKEGFDFSLFFFLTANVNCHGWIWFLFYLCNIWNEFCFIVWWFSPLKSQYLLHRIVELIDT